MNLREYERLKSKIEANAKRQLEALAIVYKLSNGSERPRRKAAAGVPPQASPSESIFADAPEHEYNGSLAGAIRKAVEDLPKEFATSDVAKRVHATHATAKAKSIAGALRRLARDEVIRMTVTGRGFKESRYEKIKIG